MRGVHAVPSTDSCGETCNRDILTILTTRREFGMTEMRAYDGKDLRKAVNAGAFLGWLGLSLPYLLYNPLLLPWAAAIGWPIAYGICWLVAAPVLRRLMKRSISWGVAAISGAGIAAIIAAIFIAIGRYRGWRASQDPNYSSIVGGGDFVRSVDGILTPYGWWVLAQNTLQFMVYGMVIALLVRWRIGPGAVQMDAEYRS